MVQLLMPLQLIDGTVTLNNNSTATTGNIYFGENGTTTCNGNVTVSNNGAQTTKRIYIGNQGDITFNGTLDITNNSSATNSQIYCNYNVNSVNSYNENITVESTDANCDGVLFGEHNGQGTLAATKTITIGVGGFIAGDLRFRNFTQTGNTAHNLTCTGTARIYCYDSNWGGDVTFTSPRIITRGTTYNRTAYLEKTGATDDVSVGGNTFKMNVDFVNSGSGYFMLGNGTFDDYQADVSLLNTGSRHIYFARAGAGHSVTGNLTANNNPSGTDCQIIIGDQTSSSLTIGGNTTITNNGGSTTKRVYLGNNGENFYRLKQIDYNGKFEQYKPIVISFENSLSPINISLYPNPITDDNDLIISCSEFNHDSKITIIDIKGSVINIEYTITEGKIILSTSNLDKGVYFVLFNVGNKQLKEMFIVE